MYTLFVFDESRSVTAIPSAGILGSFIGFVFGMYQPQAYTPLPCTFLIPLLKANCERILVSFVVMQKCCFREESGGVLDFVQPLSLEDGELLLGNLLCYLECIILALSQVFMCI
jgi:hypothetical protein